MEPLTKQRPIGFIGLGHLGTPIAANILESGYPLWVYNRSAEKMHDLVRRGAQGAQNLAELASHCDIILSMVSNDEALQAITESEEGLLNHMNPGSIHVSMSTVSPEWVRELASKHSHRGFHYVAAPVMGRPDAARARQLSLIVAGHTPSREFLEPLWEDLGARAVYDFGADASHANLAKLSINFMIASAMESMAETYALLERNGVDPQQFYQMFSGGLFGDPIYKNYGKLLLDRSFEPASFALELGFKDLRLFVEAAAAVNASVPAAAVVKERLMESIVRERGAMDWTALTQITREDGLSHG